MMDIHFLELGGYLSYSIFFLFLLLIICKRIVFSSKNNFLILGYFLLLSLVGLLDYFYEIIPYFPDSELYTAYIENKKVSTQLYSFSKGYSSTYYVSFLYKWFFIYNAFYYVVFQKFVLVLSILIIWVALKNLALSIQPLTKKDLIRLQSVYFMVVIFYPSLILYTASPLRDFLSVFLTSLFILGIVNFIIKKKHFKRLLSFSLMGFYFIRFQFVVIVVMAISLVLVFELRKNKKNHILNRIGILLLGVGASYAVYIFLDLFNYSNFLTPNGFSYLRNYFNDSYGGSDQVYGNIRFNSYLQILLYVPMYVLQFFFAPIPFLLKTNPLNFFVGFIDFIYVFALFFILLRNLKVVNYYKYLKRIFVITLFTSIPAALFEFYLSGAIRHRVPYILMMIVVVSFVLWKNKKYEITDNCSNQ